MCVCISQIDDQLLIERVKVHKSMNNFDLLAHSGHVLIDVCKRSPQQSLKKNLGANTQRAAIFFEGWLLFQSKVSQN